MRSMVEGAVASLDARATNPLIRLAPRTHRAAMSLPA